jgi:hypothetical protein
MNDGCDRNMARFQGVDAVLPEVGGGRVMSGGGLAAPGRAAGARLQGSDGIVRRRERFEAPITADRKGAWVTAWGVKGVANELR